MTLRRSSILHMFHLTLLSCAALLVPLRQRREWWREWRAELWHVRQACTPARGISWIAEREIANFCLGAFQDALCLRALPGQRRIPHATTKGSAAQCMLWLVGLAVTSYGVSLLLPGVPLASQFSHYRDAHHLMLIQNADYSGDPVATISIAQYQTWKHRRQDLFDGFAFYQVMPQTVSGTAPAKGVGRIAFASANLFSLLGLPVRFASADGQAHSDLPKLILSDEAWRTEFSSDPNVSGRVLHLGTDAAVVGGVAPKGLWRLPGKVDGWLLETDPEKFSTQMGFVVGHLKSSPVHNHWGANWMMAAPKPDGTMSDFLCMALTERMLDPQKIFLFAIFLACLALPATTSLPLGEYRVSSQKLSWSKRLRRWGFLACKIGLLLPIVYFVPLDLAHLRANINPFSSEYIQLAASFSICLFGLRWVLRDQRQRCPVCLKRLTNPARVGQPSRNFLAWSGTELICVAGHGLLHIPEIQTSWFNTQRWLYLDPSWDVLFADPGLASAGYF